MPRTAQKGQALITLLFFVIIGITVTSAAIIIIGVNSISGTKMQEGLVAYQIAESGAENGMLRVLRDPSYTGEDMTMEQGTAHVTVSSSGGVYTILSTGQVGNFTRKVQITASYVNDLLTVTSRQEVY